MRTAQIQTGRQMVRGIDPGGTTLYRLAQARWDLEAALRTNRLLRDDQWREVDTTVKAAAQPRLRLAARHVGAGMTDEVADWSVLETEYQKEFDIAAAQRSMSGRARGLSDYPESIPVITPIPIHFYDFSFEARMLAASQRRGEGLNRASARLAGRKVADSIEDMIIVGVPSINLDGRAVLGLTTEPNRNTYTLPLAWDDATITGALILTDVLAMMQLLRNDFMPGPYDIYVPLAYDTQLEDDFKAESSQTIRERLLAIDGINAVLTTDRLTADTVIMLQMEPDVAELTTGQQITNLEWEEAAGLVQNLKTMSAMSYKPKSDAEGRSGICHATV